MTKIILKRHIPDASAEPNAVINARHPAGPGWNRGAITKPSHHHPLVHALCPSRRTMACVANRARAFKARPEGMPLRSRAQLFHPVDGRQIALGSAKVT